LAGVINLSINLSKIPKSAIVKGKKGSYVNLTLGVNNEQDQFGNDGGVAIGQTKEQREAKEPKVYLGNGKVVWSDGVMPEAKWGDDVAAGAVKSKAKEEAEDDLPF